MAFVPSPRVIEKLKDPAIKARLAKRVADPPAEIRDYIRAIRASSNLTAADFALTVR